MQKTRRSAAAAALLRATLVGTVGAVGVVGVGLVGGCAADSVPVRAIGGYARLVNPEYLAYVEADGSLSEAQKQRRRDQVTSLNMILAEAQGARGGGGDE